MKYKCIIFDCDGVLVDSEEISIKILIDMANSLGVEIDMAYADINFTGKSLESVFIHIEKLAGKKFHENHERDYRDRTFKAFKSELKPIQGIHSLLNEISVPYCVASNGPIEKIRLNLSITNLLDKFQNKIFSAYTIKSWKPDPELFLHAANKMGFDPSDCVVIEDSIAGIIAAKKGGFDVFGYAKPSNHEAFEKEGAKVFFEMETLIDLLNKA
ncbi:MAG: HAD superfamily hydrolase (TIGR01509 family) [Saprospiraceae bacterium]|jgi:HAD superfamily hydrolase (TIGR01509 family)